MDQDSRGQSKTFTKVSTPTLGEDFVKIQQRCLMQDKVLYLAVSLLRTKTYSETLCHFFVSAPSCWRRGVAS